MSCRKHLILSMQGVITIIENKSNSMIATPLLLADFA